MPTKSSKGGCGEHPEFPRLAQFCIFGALTITNLLCIETLYAKWAFYANLIVQWWLQRTSQIQFD